MGRSGSTLLQRVLNVHPGVTIWGEHGGVLAGILKACTRATTDPVAKNLSIGVERQSSGEFHKWVSPFSGEDFADAMKATLLDLFTRGLGPEVRWGFKEIRYEVDTLETLMEMFPQARLVMLARDLEGQVGSRFYAFGRGDYDLSIAEDRAEAQVKLDRMISEWLTRYGDLLALAKAMPDRCSLVAYSDLAHGSERIPSLFSELEEDAPNSAAIEVVLGAKVGSSYQQNPVAMDNREMLREMIDATAYDRDRYAAIANAFGIAGF